jgi:hypothetical protein
MALLYASVIEKTGLADVENSLTVLLDTFHYGYDVVARVESVEDMCQQLLRRASDPNDLYRHIVINGHGSPGNQSVGDGVSYDASGRQNLSISWTDDVAVPTNLVGHAESKLQALRPKMTGECMVTLTGCNVAGGAGGRHLLKIISRALGGIPVQASEGLQTEFVPGAEGTVVRCSGDQCSVIPGGSWLGWPGL